MIGLLKLLPVYRTVCGLFFQVLLYIEIYISFQLASDEYLCVNQIMVFCEAVYEFKTKNSRKGCKHQNLIRTLVTKLSY